MPRLDSGQSLPIVLEAIEQVRVRNRTNRRILVEFQYLGADMRWHEIRWIRLDGGGELTAAQAELWTPGMRPGDQVRVGISGEEGGEDADVNVR
jgi:hypothetical protein